MNRTLRIVTTTVYGLIIVFVNVTALLFFLTALGGYGGQPIASGALLGVAGRYAIVYHLIAVFAPAFISVSLGNLLRRPSGFDTPFLLRMFLTELGGMAIFFLLLLLLRLYSSYH